MLEAADSPFRLWGYGITLQAISLTREGLVIRNGDQQVLIPHGDIEHFREQLAVLMDEAGSGAGDASAVRGA